MLDGGAFSRVKYLRERRVAIVGIGKENVCRVNGDRNDFRSAVDESGCSRHGGGQCRDCDVQPR